MGHNTGFKSGLLTGLVAGAVGGAIAYKKRKKIAGEYWKLKAKLDLTRRLKTVKKLTKEHYEEVVDEVLEHYKDVEYIATSELKELARALKDEWADIKERVEERKKETED